MKKINSNVTETVVSRTGLRSSSSNTERPEPKQKMADAKAQVAKKLIGRPKRKLNVQNKENAPPEPKARAVRSSKRIRKASGESISDAKQSIVDVDMAVNKNDNENTNESPMNSAELDSKQNAMPDFKDESKEIQPTYQSESKSDFKSLLDPKEIEVIEFLSELKEIRLKHKDEPKEAENSIIQESDSIDPLNNSDNIPLIVYNNEISTIEIAHKQPIAHPNYFNISLNLSCHTDGTYDFENASPFEELVEELDENNNLVMRHPKLSTFVVTSDLNQKFGLGPIQTSDSQQVLRELHILERSELMNFKGVSACSSPKASSYNWKVFRNMFNELESDPTIGLSVCREADLNPEMNFELFTSPLHQKIVEPEEEAKNEPTTTCNHEDVEVEESEQPIVETKREKMTRLPLSKKKKANNPEAKELEYAYKKAQDLFTPDELSNGIFCELNKKGEPINRSRIRATLDTEKTHKLKQAIKKKFFSDDSGDSDKIELCWSYLRKDLNKIISDKKKSP